MSSRGDVLSVKGGFKAVFDHGGQQHVVQPLRSARMAALVLDVLEVHQCLATGLPLSAAQLRSDAPLAQVARMAGGAGLQISLSSVAGGQWQDVTLPELVQQLNACAAMLAAEKGPLLFGRVGQPLVRAAAALGHLQAVQLLLALLGDATAALADTSLGITALHAAAAEGHTAVVQCMLATAPRCVEELSKDGTTALYEAAAGRHVEAARLLLAASPKTAAVAAYNGTTALHMAGASAPMTELLLPHMQHAVVAPNQWGFTPLHCAAAENCTAVMRLLLQAAPQSLHVGVNGSGGAVHAAAAYGNLQALDMLVQLAPELAAAADKDGLTPTHYASRKGQLAAVQQLLQLAPESAAAVTQQGETPLHLACRSGHLPVVEALLAQAPATAGAVSDGWLPLHEACSTGHANVIPRLLEAAPASAAAVTHQNSRAGLHLAAGWGHADAVRVLLAAAPQTALAVDIDGDTAMHLAARGAFCDAEPVPTGCTTAVEPLLAAAPAGVHVPGDLGCLPLHAAASVGHTAAVRLLLQAAPETAAVLDAEGYTALDLALHNRCTEAASLLVAAGPAAAVLTLLADAPAEDQPAAYVAAFLRAHLPLSDQQWEQLGQIATSRAAGSAPSLAPVLPAALEHSAEQARQLVRLLSGQEQARLRTFGLCLARLQRRLRVPLPGPLAGRLMALFDA